MHQGIENPDLQSNAPFSPSVSIITISQFSRFKCLQNLAKLIEFQDYSNIIEWVIVEGSSVEANAALNKHNISTLKSTFSIVYLEYESGLKLSDLRNKGNAATKGDIIVVMDDDDYYPPCRVSHAVQKLQESGCHNSIEIKGGCRRERSSLDGCLIAGTSNVYMYDYDLDILVQFDSFGPNHATNNTMAYRREYLTWNRHAPGLKNAEERSFTRDFRNFMVQLDPDKCCIVSSHGANTVCKKKLINNHYVNIINKPVTELIPVDIVALFKNTFNHL